MCSEFIWVIRTPDELYTERITSCTRKRYGVREVGRRAVICA